MNGLTLRSATPQDRPFVERVYFVTQRWLIEKLFGWRGDDVERAKFEEFYDERNTQIVQIHGEDVGWLTVLREPNRIEVDSIYVIPEKQGAGLGTLLMEQLIAEAEGAHKMLTLSTAKINPARRLYEQLGFESVDESEFKVYMERKPRKLSASVEDSKAIDIRAARDFAQLLALFDEVAAERQWIGTEPGFDKEKYRDAWQGILDGKGGAHFVACHGSDVVGALSLYPTAGGGYDLGILVSQERRGQGIGKALIREAFVWARAQGVPKLTLGVFPHNERAMRLYENLGFVAVRRLERSRVRKTGDVWDVIVMEKQMSRTPVVESSEPVTLEPYDGRWPAIFARESQIVRNALEPFGLLGTEHVGSTAIPGMTAKPIVDIIAGVESMEHLPAADDPIWTALGYECGHGTPRPEGWLYFIKRDAHSNRVAHLHVVPFEGEFWNRLIAFRDALREGADLALEYKGLKVRLAAEHGHDRLRYRDEKASFVERVVAERLRRGNTR